MAKQNTAGFGIEYEVYVPAYFALVLNNNPKIEDFAIQTNVRDFGNLDDVLVDVKTADNQRKHFAFQLKHKENKSKNLLPTNFEVKGDFCLEKYCQAFNSLKDENKKFNFILYTNKNFDCARMGEVTKFKMLPVDGGGDECFFDTSSTPGNIYRFEMNGKTSNSMDYGQFLSKFALYTCQKDFRGFEENVYNILKHKDVVLKYMDLFKKCHQGMFTNKIINKEVLNIHIIDIFLSSMTVRDRSLSTTENENLELFDEAIDQFDVTVVETCTNFIEKFVETPYHVPQRAIDAGLRYIDENAVTESVLRLAKDWKIIERSVKEVARDINLKIFHYFFEKPVIVDFNETSENLFYDAMELYKTKEKKIKFVLIGQGIDVKKLSQYRMFTNLGDLLRVNETLFEDVVRKCALSLQGRAMGLEELAKTFDEIVKITGAKELFQMLTGDCAIGEEKEALPQYYVPRTVSIPIFDLKTILEYTTETDDLFIVNFGDEFDRFETPIRDEGVVVMEVQVFLYQLENLQLPVIVSTSEDFSKREFEAFCQKTKIQKMHYLRVIRDERFMLVMSAGNTFNNLRYLVSIKESGIHKYVDHPVNILGAQPGMGKSTMLKYLKNECNADLWTIGVDLKAHNAFFKTKHNGDDVLLHFMDPEEDWFSKKLQQMFFEKKKIAIFLDGVDEVESECIDNVLECAKDLSTMGVRVWISSRLNLQQKLEDELNVFIIKIEELDEKEQKTYIKKRLQNAYKKDEIDEIIKRVFINGDIANNRQILGVPLQLYIITQIFLDDRNHYQNVTENMFVLTKMYRIFFEGRYNYSVAKADAKNPHLAVGDPEDHLEKYEIAALQSLLNDDVFAELNLDLRRNRRFLNNIKTKNDPLGIIVKVNGGNNAVFEHFTFAEYFACVFLTNNFDIARKLRQHLISEKFENLMLMLNVMLAEDHPLHLAIIYKDAESIRERLGEGCTRDKGGRTPLHLAMCNATRYPLLNCHLLSEPPYIIYDHAVETFHGEILANKKITRCLLELNIDPLEKDKLFNWNVLEYCLVYRILYVVEVILEKYGNLLLDDSHLNTLQLEANSAYYSIRFGYPNLLSAVLHRKNLPINKITISTKRSLLHLCVLNECVERIKIITLLLDHCFDGDKTKNDGYTILHFAAMEGNPVIVDFLLSKGTEVDVMSSDRFSPLYFAVMRQHFDTTAKLLDRGADVNVTNRNGMTTLHQAILLKCERMVSLLLDKGADVNVKTKQGETALSSAVKAKILGVVDLLLKKGAHADTWDKDGNNALHYAVRGGDIEIIKLLLSHGVDVNVRNAKSETALHLAFKDWKDDVLNLLIGSGADVAVAAPNGETILHHAVKNKDFKMVGQLLTGTEAKYLLNATNKKKQNALHFAVYEGEHATVDLLLTSGIDLDKIDVYNQTHPLQAALDKDGRLQGELLLKMADYIQMKQLPRLTFQNVIGHKVS